MTLSAVRMGSKISKSDEIIIQQQQGQLQGQQLQSPAGSGIGPTRVIGSVYDCAANRNFLTSSVTRVNAWNRISPATRGKFSQYRLKTLLYTVSYVSRELQRIIVSYQKCTRH